MAWLEIDGEHLSVRFSAKERVLGLTRDQVIPLAAVRSVTPVRSWTEVRGLRMGLGLPGVWLLGTWRSRQRRQLVALRRGVPALRIRLAGQKYDELLISTPEAELVRTGLESSPLVPHNSRDVDLRP
jgi:hypothetical protein